MISTLILLKNPSNAKFEKLRQTYKTPPTTFLSNLVITNQAFKILAYWKPGLELLQNDPNGTKVIFCETETKNT